MLGQFMNFDGAKELDKPIYRIMKQQHVFSLFQDRRNAMSQFGNWKDKFENFLVKGIKCDNTVREKMVAQCWTSEQYSEAMWGIYANDRKKRYLRIKSTPRKLLDALSSAQPDSANELCRVGRVNYEKTRKIKAFYDDNKNATVDMNILFQSLLLKRIAFRHEKEVRLVYFAKFGLVDDKGLFWYKVDPHKMVKQIMADPNRCRKNWITEKEEIRSHTKFCGEKIKRSKIYDAPDW